MFFVGDTFIINNIISRTASAYYANDILVDHDFWYEPDDAFSKL